MEEAEKELEAIAAGEDPVAGKKNPSVRKIYHLHIVKLILYALFWPNVNFGYYHCHL